MDDFNDDLSNLFDRSHLPKQQGEMPSPAYRPLAERAERIASAALFSERCKACNGSGRFRSYTGRDVGRCFKCNGKGQKDYKTAPETREAARTANAERKARHIKEAHETYAANNPAAYAWIISEAPRFEFAHAMREAITRYGSLTEKQQAAVDKCVARQAERATERKARVDNAPAVDASPILAAFAHARANLVTNEPVEGDVGVIISRNPTLRLAAGDPPRGFTFSPARKDPNIVYVREGETYLGKIVEGRFHRVRECDEATEGLVLQCAAAPSMAAKAYGLHYQCCGVCGRTLTNKVSRERGIGPYCAARYGF